MRCFFCTFRYFCFCFCFCSLSVIISPSVSAYGLADSPPAMLADAIVKMRERECCDHKIELVGLSVDEEDQNCVEAGVTKNSRD